MLNSYILHKMGWIEFSRWRGIKIVNSGHEISLNENDQYTRFFYNDKSKNILFMIKELSRREKHLTKKTYKFLELDLENLDTTNLNYKTNYFNSNQELFKLIIQFESCDERYKRQFKINKLLK